MRERAGTTEAGRRLVTAASELFYRYGINVVGVAAVAEAAGVTKKTLYDCFGSKAELVAAYLRERHATWWAHLEQRLDDADVPRVLTLYRAYLDHPALDVTRGCGFLNGAAELPADHPGTQVIREHKRAVYSRIVELLVADYPGVAEPGAVGEHLFLLLEGAVARSGIEGGDGQLHRAERIAETLLPA